MIIVSIVGAILVLSAIAALVKFRNVDGFGGTMASVAPILFFGTSLLLNAISPLSTFLLFIGISLGLIRLGFISRRRRKRSGA